MNLVPADTYKVYLKGIVEESKKKVLTTLYKPIIGVVALTLYETLLCDLNKGDTESIEYNHHHLETNMQVPLKEIVKAREKLEALGLLKSYYKEGSLNSYIYVLFSPVSAYEFFNDPILNDILYSNVGKLEYDNIVEKFKTSRIYLKDYTDITCSFDSVFSIVNSGEYVENNEIISDNARRLEIKSKVDLDIIEESIPSKMKSDRCFNRESKDMIKELAFLYNLDTNRMITLVRNSINEKGNIDKTLLKDNCRNSYKFENNNKLPALIHTKQPWELKEPEGDNSPIGRMVKSFEEISPYQFLKLTLKNGEPSDREKKLIEYLIIDLGLNPGVVNVLLDYVLKVNNNKLQKAFIEEIATNWKRDNIETVRDAMKKCREHHNKVSKTKEVKEVKETTKKDIKVEEKLPLWMTKGNIEKNTDKLEEFTDLLNSFDF